MADFWTGATEGLNRGVVLGERATEREADRKVREDYLAEQKRQHDQTNKRADETHTALMQDWTDKKQYEKAEKSFNAANSLYEASKVTGDVNQQRMATKLLADTYNQHWVNGDEMQIIFKGDSANNPEMAQKWDEDPNLKDKEVAILSKTGGLMPFKNLDETFKFAASNLNLKNFTAGVKQAETKIAELNAAEQPFTAEDGHKYLKTWQLGPGGIPQAGPVRALTDVEAKQTKSPGQAKLGEARAVLGREPTPSEKKVAAGLASPEGETAAELHRAQTQKVRQEGKGETTKQQLELTNKQLDTFKKDMDLLLRPFAAPGKTLIDDDGELNNDGHVAFDAASKLVDKADAEPDALTKEEKRKVDFARRALGTYEKISGHIAARYDVRNEPTIADIEAEAKRRGLVKDPTTGKWVKPKK
jgi:hypothetical protein